MTTPSRSARIAVAFVIGLCSVAFAYYHLAYRERALGFDFTWPWRAARYLIAGQNPYDMIKPVGDFPFDAYFKYPLPAALLAMPFAWLNGPLAAAAFGGISAGLLAFGLTARGWGRLFILASPAFLITLWSGQWSTLLMAGALLPALSWVAVCKPTVGVAVFAYRPNLIAIIGSLALAALSFLFLPSWLSDWLRILRTDDLAKWYMAPIALIGGQVMLLALLRWRRPEARFLLVVSVIPQILGFYTGFLPLLVAETRRESLVMSIGSAIAWAGCTIWLGDRSFSSTAPIHAGYWLLPFVFVPALIIVLRRPNEGRVPQLIERIVAIAPPWLRGAPSSA